MKNTLLFLLLCICVKSFGAYYYVNTEQLKVHANFDLNSEVLDTVHFSDTLFIDKITDQWAFIKSDSLTGYVNINYLNEFENQVEIKELKDGTSWDIDYKFYIILILMILIIIYFIYERILRFWVGLIVLSSLIIGLLYFWMYPLFLILGFIIIYRLNKNKQSIDHKLLFELTDNEKKRFQEIKIELVHLLKKNEILNTEILDAGLIKTNNGKYDERNRTAKKINEELPKLTSQIEKLKKEYRFFENKPIKNRANYISLIAFNSSVVYLFLISFSLYIYFFFSFSNYHFTTLFLKIQPSHYFHLLLILFISLLIGSVLCIIMFYSYKKRYNNEIPKIVI